MSSNLTVAQILTGKAKYYPVLIFK